MKTCKVLLISLLGIVVLSQASAQNRIQVVNLPVATGNGLIKSLPGKGVIITYEGHMPNRNVDPSDFAAFTAGVDLGREANTNQYKVLNVSSYVTPYRFDADYRVFSYTGGADLNQVCSIHITDDKYWTRTPKSSGYCRLDCQDEGYNGTNPLFRLTFQSTWHANYQGTSCRTT